MLLLYFYGDSINLRILIQSHSRGVACYINVGRIYFMTLSARWRLLRQSVTNWRPLQLSWSFWHSYHLLFATRAHHSLASRILSVIQATDSNRLENISMNSKNTLSYIIYLWRKQVAVPSTVPKLLQLGSACHQTLQHIYWGTTSRCGGHASDYFSSYPPLTQRPPWFAVKIQNNKFVT